MAGQGPDGTGTNESAAPAANGATRGAGDRAGGKAPVDLMVDWELAARTAARLAGAGPQISPQDAARAVGELRSAAVRAVLPVAEVARLQPAEGAIQTLVVDRAGWSRANTDFMRALLEPVLADVFARRTDLRPNAVVAGIGSRFTGAEVGSLMGFIASRVLGQYEPFREPGRLLLIAPNIVAAERELGVDPGDFRLWVCLHEQTHRLQFTANPWLAAHLRGEIQALLTSALDSPGQAVDRFRGALGGITELVRGQGGGDGSASVLDLVTTPDQRRKLAELTAVMSLLEGHADVVMDDVGPAVVPTVAHIRERFTKRRQGRGGLDQVLRRVLGLDAKLRQYVEGAEFVRGVQARVGVDGFNAVWAGPQNLPLPEEIADPQAWVTRVHG